MNCVPGGRNRNFAPRRAEGSLWLLGLAILMIGCGPQETPTPPPREQTASDTVVLKDTVVMVGAGDIAVCGTEGDEATASLVDSVLKADSAANLKTVVFTMGDNAYPSGDQGADNDFARCFTPSWGDKSKRIMKLIRPSPGNHDFETESGPGYYKYFGDRAGPPGKGYYSYDVGKWHAISLNSEILVDESTAKQAKAQEDWLRADLKAHPQLCTLAYFHRPLFSSGSLHGPTPEAEGLWNIMYQAGVDLVINGHDHHYERFLPQTPSGEADPVKGIAEIIVGTGGGDLRGLRSPLMPNSAEQIEGHFGVLKLTLGEGAYRHAFLDTEGRVWDQGGGKCR